LSAYGNEDRDYNDRGPSGRAAYRRRGSSYDDQGYDDYDPYASRNAERYDSRGYDGPGYGEPYPGAPVTAPVPPQYSARADIPVTARPAYLPEQHEWADPEERKARKTPKGLVVFAAVAALVLVGAIAYAGTIVFGGDGKTPTSPTAAGQGGGEVIDPTPITSVADDPTPSDGPSSTAPSPTKTTPKASATTTKPGNNGGGNATGNAGLENAVVSIVNTERAKAGCQPLTVDSRLVTAARKHSADMVARHFFDHTNPDGVTFDKRITNEGYRFSAAAENIAAGQRTPQDVMNAWLNSPGHRANILNCKLRQLGVGVAMDGRRPVWTQDFATPR
jgi:uncharacterized protein YkwD